MFKKLLIGMLVMTLVSSLSIGTLVGRETITFWSAVPPSHGYDIEAIEEFEKAFPNIKINREYVEMGNMSQKVMIAIAGAMTPDVLTDDACRVSSWWYQDVLVSLNGKLSEEDLNDFIPSILNFLTLEGNLIGYPLNYGARTWSINKNLVEKAGVVNLLPSGENLEWFLSDFMEVAEAIAQLDEGIYPLGFFANLPSGDYYMLINFQMFGATLYQNGDYTKTTLNSEEGIKALEWMIQMVEEGYAPKGVAGISCGDWLNMIVAGKVATGYAYDPKRRQEHFDQGLIGYLAEDYIVEPPHVRGTPAPPMFIAPQVVSVFKGDKVDSALKFAEFFANKESTRRLIDILPGTLSSRKSVLPIGDEAVTIAQNIVMKNGVGDLGMNSPHYLEVRNLQFPELQAAFSGLKTPREALNDFAEAVANLWK